MQSCDRGWASLIRNWFDAKTNYCHSKRKDGKLPLFSGVVLQLISRSIRIRGAFTRGYQPSNEKLHRLSAANDTHAPPVLVRAHTHTEDNWEKERDSGIMRCTFSRMWIFFHTNNINKINETLTAIDPSIIPGNPTITPRPLIIMPHGISFHWIG